MKAILGRKVGMRQVFGDDGRAIPVTVIQAGPCYVTQVKTLERDGYRAAQLGFEEVKPEKLSGGERGHLASSKTTALRMLREFRLRAGEDVTVGQQINVDTFEVGEHVDVVGVSKGRGFAGAMKRHGFGGGPATHGQSDRMRATGSVGAGTNPGRVLKGKKMPGRMGGGLVSAQNLRIEAIDTERNLLAVRGGVPGTRGGLLVIRGARKSRELVRQRGE